MTNTLIFVILLYLIATNNFCKLFIDKLGIHLLLRKLEYANTPEGVTEIHKTKFMTLISFNRSKPPF